MGSRVSTTNESLRIPIGGDEEDRMKEQGRYPMNQVKSTKYTLITFLPLNLLEQFRRVANFYFLAVIITAFIINSPVSPITTAIALFFVIGVTAVKQGYEDYLRHKADNIVNRSLVTILSNGQPKSVQCQCVSPGDLVIVERDCDVPCDLVLLSSSDHRGKCFVTTANLDGESNLKTLLIPRDLPLVDIDKLCKLGVIECESPKTDLYSFNGKIELSNQFGDSRVLPLTAENVLLRGSRVKNTECVIGCAVYTGMTTKLQLNSRLTRNKSATSEIYINRFLFVIFAALIAVVNLLYFLQRNEKPFVAQKLWYLGPPADGYSVQQFLQDYLSFLVLFNYIIPISLYVSIELYRVIGSFFMEWDLELYDETTDQPCIVNTSNLNEDLGQINILFSDKTGTLTKNEMIFQQCSINGRKYTYKKTRLQEAGTEILLDINKFSEEQNIFFQAVTICHTVQVADNWIDQTGDKFVKDETLNSNAFNIIQNNEFPSSIDFLLYKSGKEPNAVDRISGGLQTVNSSFLEHLQTNRHISLQSKDSNSDKNLPEFEDISSSSNHRRPTLSSINSDSASYKEPDSTAVSSVRRSLSIASRESYATPNFQRQPTLLIRSESIRRKREIQETVQTLDYQASSPDEKALVEACAHLGLVYTGDDDEILKIRVMPPHMDYARPFSVSKPSELHFNRLHVLEFTSDRRRMSILVKDGSGAKWIYTKGAESYVFPLCASSSADMIKKTNQHINEFARQGLRTLAIARKRITEEDYQEFMGGVNYANSSLKNRKELFEKCYAKIETDLELLGATAVEDALQDEVADTLISLQKAGIKIWVLTGDKVETTLNIALSCGHVPPNAEKYFIVECARKEDILQHLSNLDAKLEQGNGRHCALLIDGTSLTVALAEASKEFRDVATKCVAVLCCRLSPLQKSEVVTLIKSAPENYNTAAIGDGANDVSMIQEAHVGIGITGKEGRQAARYADFALAKFCMLKRLLLVHGHYYTRRLSLSILYCFYKNVVSMGVMFIFQFYTLMSSTSIYDSLFLSLYNLYFAAWPILFISLTEKPYTEEELMKHPQLYKKNANNKSLRWRYFFGWILNGVVHALIIYYFTYFMFTTNDILLNVGQTADLPCFGVLLLQTVVIVVNLKLWIEAKYLSYWYIGTIILSILAFMLTVVVYNVVNLRLDTDIYWTYNKLLSSIPVWLFTIITVVACLLPDFIKRISQADALRRYRYSPHGSKVGSISPK